MLFAGIHNEAAGGFDVVTSYVESFAGLRAAQGALHFDGPSLFGSEVQQEIDLGSGCGAVEKRIRCRRRGHENIFDDEAFPGWPDDGVTEQLVLVRDSEQRVDDAAVAHVDLGRAHESL